MPAQFAPGDFPASPPDKPGYTLGFHDEFDGPALDTGKWLPFYLPHWSSRARTAPHYTFDNSNLILQIVKDQPAWCPEFDGDVRASVLQTGTFSGPVGSSVGQLRFNPRCVVREAQTNVQTYLPQYGYFEMRAKSINSGGNHAALWMIGYEDVPERSAEICVCELVGKHTGAASSRVGYGVRRWADPAIKDEFYEEFFAIDAAHYHLYGIEWTPDHIDFYIDTVKIRTIQQSPGYPMQLMLSLYEHPFEGAWTGPYDPAAPYPKAFAVDYLRVYQPEGGYR